MAIIVEHEKRKKEILKKSMELFCREGYEDVTFQKIADACGITRTTLYIYFKNKREIFNFSIKQASAVFQERFMETIKDQNLSAEECLRKLVCGAIDVCVENRALIEVLVPYLSNLQKTGVDPEERVRRRTLKVNHILNMVIIRGQKNGEFKKVNVKDAHNMLFNLIEAAVFKMAMYHKEDMEEAKAGVNLAIDGLLNR